MEKIGRVARTLVFQAMLRVRRLCSSRSGRRSFCDTPSAKCAVHYEGMRSALSLCAPGGEIHPIVPVCARGRRRYSTVRSPLYENSYLQAACHTIAPPSVKRFARTSDDGAHARWRNSERWKCCRVRSENREKSGYVLNDCSVFCLGRSSARYLRPSDAYHMLWYIFMQAQKWARFARLIGRSWMVSTGKIAFVTVSCRGVAAFVPDSPEH